MPSSLENNPQVNIAESRERPEGGNTLTSHLDKVLHEPRLLWVIVALGLILRTSEYFSNRSLWMDEAMLALNLLERSYSGLLEPLTYYQYAPVGFLMAQKFVIQIFGNSEFALRLIPFGCALASMILFAVVAKRLAEPCTASIAVFLFAVCDALVYYSSEVKQYSSDVFVTLILCWAMMRCVESCSELRITIYGLLGAVLIWFSHPSVFVLGATGIVLLVHVWKEGNRLRLILLAILIAVWLASFSTTYVLFLSEPLHSSGLRGELALLLPPGIPSSVRDVHAYLRLFFGVFSEAFGFILPGICALAFILGLISLWRSRIPGIRVYNLLLFLAAVVSIAGIYPIRGRTILYLAPALFLAMGSGAAMLWRIGRERLPAIGWTFLVLLCLHPGLQAGYHLLVRPRIRQELRPVLQAIQPRFHEGDTIYVYHNACAAFDYYHTHRGLIKGAKVIRGQHPEGDINHYIDQIEPLRGNPRVWFVFAHSRDTQGAEDEPFFLAYLNRIGTKKFEISIMNEFVRAPEIRKTGASAYLYDLLDSKRPQSEEEH